MGPKVRYTLVSNEKEEAITAWPIDSVQPKIAHSTHPNYAKIKELCLKDDPEVFKLFDIAESVEIEFKKISDRVAIEHGKILFDGDIVDNSCTKIIVDFVREGRDDYEPLVKFLEKVMMNPQKHSRDQLYSWLDKNNFSINSEGNILAYKSVQPATVELKGQGFQYQSVHAGPAVIDGKRHNSGQVPQKNGSIVEMPRSAVDKATNVACSSGLHVGDWSYARDFSGSIKLLVEVNPRDVVAVPNDSSYRKVRTCRYKVLREVRAPEKGALVL